MICPKCNTKNMPGRIFCLKCGAELPQPKAPGQFIPREEKKRGSGSGGGCGGCLAVIIILLLIITAGVYLLLAEAKIPSFPISEEQARNLEMQIRRVELSSQKGQAIELSIVGDEINSYLKKGFTAPGLDKVRGYFKEGVDLEDIAVKLEGEQMQVWMQVYYKFKRLSINLTGRLETTGNKANFIPQIIKVGKVSLPLKLSPYIPRMLRKDVEDFSFTLPAYVEKVLIVDGKMVIKGKK